MGRALVVDCQHCGAENQLPEEALRIGRYRCHACGEVGVVPEELAPPRETPVTHEEPVQTTPSYAASAHNTPEAMRRAEEEASRVGCLVALLLAAALLPTAAGRPAREGSHGP